MSKDEYVVYELFMSEYANDDFFACTYDAIIEEVENGAD